MCTVVALLGIARDLEASKRSIRSHYIVIQCNIRIRKEDRDEECLITPSLKEEKEGVKWDSIYVLA